MVLVFAFDTTFAALANKSEVGGRKSEVESRKSEVRSRKSEVGSRKSEVGSRKSEVRSSKSEVRSPKSEVGRRKSEVESRKSEVPPRLSLSVLFHFKNQRSRGRYCHLLIFVRCWQYFAGVDGVTPILVFVTISV